MLDQLLLGQIIQAFLDFFSTGIIDLILSLFTGLFGGGAT